MSTFRELLEKLDAILQKYNSENYKKLQTPLNQKDIAEKLHIVGLYSEDVVELFNWKNGTSENQLPAMLFPFESWLLSLEDIVVFNQKNLPPVNKQGLIMIMDNGEDCLLFNSIPGNNFGKIHLYSVSLLCIDPKPYFDSLVTMLHTTISLYEEGGIFFDNSNGFLTTNMEKYIRIYNEWNPVSNFYKSV